MQRDRVDGVFSRSWQLLRSNWTIVVPGLLVGAISGVLTAIFAPPISLDSASAPVSSNVFVIGRFATTFVSIVATIVSITFTTGMANAAWQRGSAVFADGARAFGRDGTRVLVAMIGLFALGIIATAIAPYTFFLSLLAYLYLFIYTMAAAVVGELGGLDAIRLSAQIAIQRAAPTAIMVILIVFITLVMSIVASFFAETPFVGPLLSALVLQAAIAYLTLVVVGEYLALHGPAQPLDLQHP
jgi:hypothetical protein